MTIMEQENERVLYNIQNGARMVSILLFADARMALRVISDVLQAA